MVTLPHCLTPQLLPQSEQQTECVLLLRCSYQVGDTQKRVNSIEYFRTGIEPKWEDERNQNGGRFIFQVSKSQPNKEEIYQQLTFFFLGEDFDRSDKVNGFRFISSKVNNPSSYRF